MVLIYWKVYGDNGFKRDKTGGRAGGNTDLSSDAFRFEGDGGWLSEWLVMIARALTASHKNHGSAQNILVHKPYEDLYISPRTYTNH